MIQKNQNNLNRFTDHDGKSCEVCKELLTNLQQFFDMLGTTDNSSASDWLTVDDIAKELRISKSIVYRLIRSGKIEAVNLVDSNGEIAQKGHYRVNQLSLNNYLESKKVKPLPDSSPRTSRVKDYPKVRNIIGL